MNKYSSTITSKGTVTLPAQLRHKLGLVTGGRVTISLKGGSFVIKPQGTWDDFMNIRDEINDKTKNKVKNIDSATDSAKIYFYKNKFGIK